MRIEIQVFNTTTNELEFKASAPDVDSAIAELGTIERAINDCHCTLCSEPSVDELCSQECEDKYSEQINERQNEANSQPDIPHATCDRG